MRILSAFAKVMLLAVLVPVVAGGCCPDQAKIQQLTIMNRDLQKQIVDKDAEIARLQERVSWLEQSTNGLKADIAAKLAQIAKMQEEIDALKAALAQSEAAYRELAGKMAGMGSGRSPLPEQVNIKLRALAAAYPGLFTFDEATGQLRFSADVTFDSGSDVVKPDAKDALTKLAAILQDDVAKRVVADIVGYTDNQRVAKPETVAKFGNNQRLSEARAEAVKAVLTGAGIAAERVSTKGMGEANPIADNKSKDGMAKNRRVEIYLKMSGAAAPAAPAAPAPAMSTPTVPPVPAVPSAATK